MIITAGKPCAVTDKGGRRNNEDAIFPMPESANSNQEIFMVCDGVGGNERGEVASNLACESINTYISTFVDKDPTKEVIEKAVMYAEACFDSYVNEHPEAKGMATTLAMTYITSNGILLAHMGDTRIYYLRNGEILYRSDDHSLVNMLLKLGKITKEELSTHPKKNVITRDIQGSDNHNEPEVVLWDDVKPDDYILMCTDGFREAVNDDMIKEMFNGQKAICDIKDALLNACDGNTRDNFSFYIIPVQKVQESANLKQNVLSFLYSFI